MADDEDTNNHSSIDMATGTEPTDSSITNAPVIKEDALVEPADATERTSSTTSSPTPMAAEEDEEEVSFEQTTEEPTLETDTAEEDAVASPPTISTGTTADGISQSPFRQKAVDRPLLNRFSTWRQKANENAQALWRRTSETKLPLRTASLDDGAAAASTTTASVSSKAADPQPIGLQRSVSTPNRPLPTVNSGTDPKEAQEDAVVDKETLTKPPGSPTTIENDVGSDDDDDHHDDDASSLYEESETSSAYWGSSVTGTTVTDEGLRQQLQLAASSLVDSVQAGIYRGRYSNPNSTLRRPSSSLPMSMVPTQQPAVPSQTSRIMNSAQASHLQQLLQSLEPHEYIMLLGKGMLGVNLKQSYLKSQGVYVDFLVRHGAADRSQVIMIGDGLVQVGDENVQRGNIRQVPQQIASAKRPVHLVLATGRVVPVKRVNAMDVALGCMHHVRDRAVHEAEAEAEAAKAETAAAAAAAAAEALSRGSSTLKAQAISEIVGGELADRVDDEAKNDEEAKSDDDNKSAESDNASDRAETGGPDAESDDDMKLVQPTSFDTAEKEEDWMMKDVPIPIDTSVEGLVNPASPPLAVRQAYHSQVVRRNNDGFSIPMLCQAAATDENFRAALRNALLLCTMDGRRFPFLAQFLLEYEEQRAISEETTGAAAMAPNAMLMLLMEMINFADLHGATPASRRHDIARRIAYKFFLPTKTGLELTPPAFDFHHIVPVSSLRRLEAALVDTETEIPRDLFLDFSHAVLDSLSGRPFISFLASNECARMRAYLRNVAPFVNVPLKEVFDSLVTKSVNSSAKNYFLYLLSFLLCRTDKDSHGENDDILGDPNASRIEEAASGICAAVFIRGVLLPVVEQFRAFPTEDTCKAVIETFERFWETFVAPGVGALEHSSHSYEAEERLYAVRKALEEVGPQAVKTESGEVHQQQTVSLLVDEKLSEEMGQLADELLYEYVSDDHTRFREHKLYEWLCDEIAKQEDASSGPIPELPAGCIKRLLRKAEFPSGISSHKPAHVPLSMDVTESTGRLVSTAPDQLNAECAVVFGTSVGLDQAAQIPSAAIDQGDIRRYTCQTLGPSVSEESVDVITPEHIPATLESYAVVPPSRANKPFANFAEDVWRSSDGWEASLVNFMIPRADTSSEDGGESSLFGVSLVFQKRLATTQGAPVEQIQTELVHDEVESASDIEPVSTHDDDSQSEIRASDSNVSAPQSLRSPISFDTPKRSNMAEAATKRKVRVSISSPIFNERLHELPWTERISNEVSDDDACVTVGLALVSHHNVILAMRETLVALLREFSRGPDEEASNTLVCGPLVDILGNFAHQDVETASLKCILDPFLRSTVKPWLERPIASQKEEFERLAGQQLIRSLPPIPLALLFVTALLEQKIVLSSSRRSILMSATTALQQLLEPLKWCHLIVPRVPSALAPDLIQYPAPFILGMPSEDPGVMDLIRDLPQDVTLVDLDVGRVILAPSFAHNSEMGRGTPNNEDTARALRSQVLYLAQSLGNVFGAQMDGATWSCDRPMLEPIVTPPQSQFDTLRSVCHGFIDELLAGTASCCYWVEEAGNASSEPTVLFDEDRFFHVKNLRQRNGFRPLLASSASPTLALSLDDFDLVLEIFLRCQSMNMFVSSRPRQEMIFSL